MPGASSRWPSTSSPRRQDVPDGEHIVVDVNGRSVGIFNVERRVLRAAEPVPASGRSDVRGPDGRPAWSPTVPASSASTTDHKLLACPWHGWEFDIKTGQSYFDPMRTRIRQYPVEVEDGHLVAEELSDAESGTSLVKGPYTAETVAVSVEQDYLVVRMRG